MTTRTFNQLVEAATDRLLRDTEGCRIISSLDDRGWSSDASMRLFAKAVLDVLDLHVDAKGEIYSPAPTSAIQPQGRPYNRYSRERRRR